MNRANQCPMCIWALLRGQSSFNSRDDTSLLRIYARNSNIGFLQSSTWMQQHIAHRDKDNTPQSQQDTVTPVHFHKKKMKQWWEKWMPKIFSTHICKKKHPQNYRYFTWKKSQPKAPPVVPFARSPRAPCGSAPSCLHSASAGAVAVPRRPPHAPDGRSRLGDIAPWSSATFWEKKHGWYSISNILCNIIYVNMSWYISLIFFDLFFNFPLSVDIAAEIRQRWSAKTKTSTSSVPCDPSHVVLPLWENPPTKTTTWNFCRRASKALVDKESPLHSGYHLFRLLRRACLSPSTEKPADSSL